jgi:TRAP-type C4-dicarboxylate transport system permease small subunit
MSRIKKIVIKLLDALELHIPVILFSAVFIMYVIMIVYRYILHKAVFEMNELCQVLYLSSALLGASYAGRTDSHVVFPLLYDKLKPKGQKVSRMIADVIVVTLCVWIWYPTVKSMTWMARKKTEVLDIPFSWMYAIFLIFITLTAVYYLFNFIKDLRTPAAENKDTKEIQETP